MQIAELLSKVKHVGELCEERLMHLNHGGCGVYATKLGKKVRECGFDCSIRVIASEWFFAPQDINKELAEKRPRNAEEMESILPAVAHLMLLIKAPEGLWTADSHYIVEGKPSRWENPENGREYPVLKGELPMEKAQWLVDDEDIWNSSFVRSTGSVIIDQTIAEVFS